MFQWLRAPLRVLLWAFVLTLPITIFPIVSGVIEGIVFQQYMLETSTASAHSFLGNSGSEVSKTLFGGPRVYRSPSPGASPYDNAKIDNHLMWWKSLGLRRFDMDQEVAATDSVGGIMYASSKLDTLFKRVRHERMEEPWHHWVYASAQPNLTQEDGWDQAFTELLYNDDDISQGKPARLSYISCPSTFLCDFWRVKAPALVHFSTFKSEIGSNKSSGTQLKPGYEPVIVRVIEFPSPDSDEVCLRPGVFPSYRHQLESIVRDPFCWQRHITYSEAERLMIRYRSLRKDMKRTHANVYGRLVRAERLLLDNTGLVKIEFGFDVLRLFNMILTYQAKNVLDSTMKPILALVSNRPHAVEKAPVQKKSLTIPDDPIAKAINGFLKSLPEDEREKLIASMDDEAEAKNTWEKMLMGDRYVAYLSSLPDDTLETLRAKGLRFP